MAEHVRVYPWDPSVDEKLKAEIDKLKPANLFDIHGNPIKKDVAPYSASAADGPTTITTRPDTINRHDDTEALPIPSDERFFSDIAGSGFSEATDVEDQPGKGGRTAALAIGTSVLATLLIVGGAKGLISPDKPAAQAELHVTPPVEAPGEELEQPDTGTPMPKPTDLPKSLVVAPAPPVSETTTTTKPSAHATAAPSATPRVSQPTSRRTTTTEAPFVPIAPRDTAEPTTPAVPPTTAEAPTPTATETDIPSPTPEAPEPSPDTINALRREVSGLARAQAGEYASSRSLDQILADTGFDWQTVLDWQQRYRSSGPDTTATLENSLWGGNYSAILELAHYTDQVQQKAANTNNGDMFDLAWADHRTAAQLRSRLQSGEVLRFPDATTANLAKVTTRSFDGHEITLAAVVAQYPDQFGGGEKRLQWYVVVAGTEGASKLVRLAEKTDQPPFVEPIVEPTPEPTSSDEPTAEPMPTVEPTTEITPSEEVSPADSNTNREVRLDRANDRRDRRPSWLRGDRGHNRSFR